jgi:hypothetical protein
VDSLTIKAACTVILENEKNIRKSLKKRRGEYTKIGSLKQPAEVWWRKRCVIKPLYKLKKGRG